MGRPQVGDVERTVNVEGEPVYIYRLISCDECDAAVPFMAVAESDDGYYAIVANDAALQLHKKMFRAMVAHEAGHAVLGHIEQHADVEHVYRHTQEEVDADLYAAAVAGKQHVLAMLELLLTSIQKHMPGETSAISEIKTRISVVKRLAH